MKILLVDDEPLTGASLAPALRAGDRIESVTDGRVAFEILTKQAQNFDVAVIDHMMPGWAGAELITRLDLAGFRGNYIVISGYLTPGVQALYASLGVKHIIAKPIDFGELKSALTDVEESIHGTGG
jgi:CheY-like chemotaxis protein